MKISHMVLTVLMMVSATPVLAEEMHGMADTSHVMMNERDLIWMDAPPSLPRGAKVAILEGDPSKPGPFTMRIRLPRNYNIAPHWHPAIEHVTVISGTFSVGKGSTVETKAMKTLTRGGFSVMQPRSAHYARSKSGAIVQVHGVGPWAINYVRPEDDPRRVPGVPYVNN